MEKYQYVSVNNLLGKFNRDFRGLDINETDAIEWVGDALGFAKVAASLKEAVAFMEVRDYQVTMPKNLHYIIQIARDNTYVDKTTLCPDTITDIITEETVADCKNCGNWIAVDCNGVPLFDEPTYYKPYFDLVGEYYGWRSSTYYKANYTTVRLSNHSFFNSLVCQDPEDASVYSTRSQIDDEYTIIEGNTLRFNFKTGFVAVAYLKQPTDENGYPLVPDDSSIRQAITYYLTWMIKQRECFMHREGACQLADRAEQHWLKYIKQFRNKAKMPHGLDQHQNLAESSRYLIPRHNRYYGFFGNLGKMEDRPFNNPNKRRYIWKNQI